MIKAGIAPGNVFAFASNFGCETKLFFLNSNLAFFTEPLSSWVNHNEKSTQQTLSFCQPMDRPLD